MKSRELIGLFDIASERVRKEIVREMLQEAYDDSRNAPSRYSSSNVDVKIRELAKQYGVEVEE